MQDRYVSYVRGNLYRYQGSQVNVARVSYSVLLADESSVSLITMTSLIRGVDGCRCLECLVLLIKPEAEREERLPRFLLKRRSVL